MTAQTTSEPDWLDDNVLSFRTLGSMEAWRDDGRTRRIVVTAATERPVLSTHSNARMSWLDMKKGVFDILNSGRAPLLLDHRRQIESVVGVVEKAYVAGTQLKALVRFGTTPRCLEVWQLVVEGVLRNVSIGHNVMFDEVDKFGVQRASWWRPTEISLVSVPADWEARVDSVWPKQREVLEFYARWAGQAAVGTEESWKEWARRTAQALRTNGVDGLEADLVSSVSAEFERMRTDASAFFNDKIAAMQSGT